MEESERTSGSNSTLYSCEMRSSARLLPVLLGLSRMVVERESADLGCDLCISSVGLFCAVIGEKLMESGV